MFFGIVAMVLVGLSWTAIGYVMGKAPKQQINIPCLIVLSSLFAVLCGLVVGLCQGIPPVSRCCLLLTAGSLLAGGFANYFQLDLMSRAMQRGPNGIIWSILQSGFIFPFFMGIIFFGVKLTPLRLAGVIALLTALMLFGAGKSTESSGRWKLLTFGAFLSTGITQSLCNLPSYFSEAEAISGVWRTVFCMFGIALGGILVEMPKGKVFFREFKGNLVSWKIWKNALLLEIPSMIASFLLLYRGMDILSKLEIGSIAYPLMVCSCIMFFELFAILILHEKRKFVQWLALMLCLAGAVGISI